MINGLGQQKWMRESIEELRREALRDRTVFTDDELEELEVSFPDGGGKTNPWTYLVQQYPFPQNWNIRQPKWIDIRELPGR